MFASNHCSHLIAKLNWGIASQIPQTPHAKAVGSIILITLNTGKVIEQTTIEPLVAGSVCRPPVAAFANVVETSACIVTITTRSLQSFSE